MIHFGITIHKDFHAPDKTWKVNKMALQSALQALNPFIRIPGK